MDISPTTDYILAMRGRHLSWIQLMFEMVDNSCNAGALRVVLDFSRKGRFSVSDDGAGCADLHKMLAPGARGENNPKSVGKFGVGLKDAMIGTGDAVSIDSVCAGMRRRVEVDWQEVMKSGTWKVKDPDPSPVATGVPNGTTVTVSELHRDRPPNFDSLHRSLARTYAPALATSNLQILLHRPKTEKPVHIQPEPEPTLDQLDTEDFHFSKGRSAVVRMGIIREPHLRNREGTTLAIHGGRVMKDRTRIGLGEEPTPGLYCHVAVNTAWALKRNKDGMAEAEERFLGGHIEARFIALIRAARARAEDISLGQVNKILGLIPAAMRRHTERTRKAKRRPPVNHTGTVTPTGRGSPHTQARKTQKGPRFPGGGPAGALHLQREARGEASPLFSLESSKATVNANTDNAFYKRFGDNTDVLMPLAIEFYVSQLEIATEKMNLPFLEEIEDAQKRHEAAVSYFLDRYVEARGMAEEDEAVAS